MTHSGKWINRDKMAKATWRFGALITVMGGVGLFMDKPTEALVVSGCGMITMVVGIMVAGKVSHDKGSQDGPST